MKKKKTIAIIVIIVVLVVTFCICAYVKYKSNNLNDLEDKNNISSVKTETDLEKIEETKKLKAELGVKGKDDIYEISKNEDGTKTLVIKPEVEYNVALAGVLNKNDNITFENVNQKIENAPSKNGIWISKDSRDSFTKMINKLTEGKYIVDNDGYLQVNKEGKNTYNKDLKDIINGDKLVIIDISGKCYTVDQVSGDILENPFEEMDPYQTYDYYETDNNQKIVVTLTTNKYKKLTDKEIIESVIELLKLI